MTYLLHSYPPSKYSRTQESISKGPLSIPHLRATAACTFSTSQLPKVLRICCALSSSLSHVLRPTTGCVVSTFQPPKVLRTEVFSSWYDFEMCFARVHFFDLSSPRWLLTSRFTKPNFRPCGATKHGAKHNVSRLPTSAFPFVHFIGSLTSKLPSVIDTTKRQHFAAFFGVNPRISSPKIVFVQVEMVSCPRTQQKCLETRVVFRRRGREKKGTRFGWDPTHGPTMFWSSFALIVSTQFFSHIS